MADERQFGNPKRMQFGDTDTQTGVAVQCAQCEAMLADALDGALTADRQERMDAHVAECGLCSQTLADARRGAAWLEMLRTPRPEPPATLLEQILAATSWAQASFSAGRMVARGVDHVGAAGAGAGRMSGVVPAFVPTGTAASCGNVLPFRARATAALRNSSLGQIALQPRFAMTAAMAFFSIALTMNLTGVHPLSLRASDLRPSSMKRNLADADARVVRYYEGLRVVYELESRVHDFEGTTDSDLPAGSQSEPSNPVQPAVQSPAAQPGSGGRKDSSPADRNQPERKRPSANPGTSRREEPGPGRHFISVRRFGMGCDNHIQDPGERVMA